MFGSDWQVVGTKVVYTMQFSCPPRLQTFKFPREQILERRRARSQVRGNDRLALGSRSKGLPAFSWCLETGGLPYLRDV